MWQSKGKIMATATYKTIKVISLTLSAEEADYIQGMVKNYIGENPDDEIFEYKQIRESIFEALFSAKRENNEH